MSHVLTKSAKGLREATGKTSDLPRDLRDVLKACKGQFAIEDLVGSLPEDDQEAFALAVIKLLEDEFLREIHELSSDDSEPESDELDFSSGQTFSPDAGGSTQQPTNAGALTALAGGGDITKSQQKQAGETARRLIADAERSDEERERQQKEAEIAERKARQKEKWAEQKAAMEREQREAEARRSSEQDAMAKAHADELAQRDEEERMRQEGREAEANERQLRRDFERAQRDALDQARRDAEAMARTEAEERARNASLEKARRKAEDQARRDDEERRRREDEARERAEREERERREQAERLKRKAEEAARKAEEDRIRREAEAKAKAEAEERARLDAIEKAKRKAEEKARREEEDRERREAEIKAKAEAEERARIEAEERERELIRERLRGIRRRNTKLGAITGTIMAIAGALFVLQSVSFDGKRAEIEGMASQAVGTSVKAAAARIELFPTFRWVLEDVRIGEGDAQVKADVVGLQASPTALFSLPAAFSSATITGLKLPVSGMANALLGTGKLPLSGGQASLVRAELSADSLKLPPLSVSLNIADGRVVGFAASGSDAERGKAELTGEMAADHWKLTGNAQHMLLPLGLNTDFSDVSVKAELRPGRLDLVEFGGSIHSSEIRGNGVLAWDSKWTLVADYKVTRMDLSKLLPGWFADGFAAGEGVVKAEASTAAGLLANPKVSGSFNTGLGKLIGVNLDRVLQSKGNGDHTGFDGISGRYLLDANRADVSDIVLQSKTLIGRGRIGIAPDKVVSGRIGIEARTAVMRFASSVTVAGTVAAPKIQP